MPPKEQTQITCETLKEEYQALQDIANEYQEVLMSEGKDSEKTKKARIAFDTATGNLREHIRLYKEQQEGISYLSADYRSGEEYLEALQEKGYEVTKYAKGLLNQLTDIPEEQVRLKKVTVEDLGFSSSATTEEILAVAEKKGLKPCPPWVGPQHRMQCKDDEHTVIGMEPMTASNGDASSFLSIAVSVVAGWAAIVRGVVGVLTTSFCLSPRKIALDPRTFALCP